MTAPGTQVGPYVILRKLGEGGMGEVHLARDPRLEREVALKTLPAEFGTNSDRMARFRREALALAAINHPNIATVFGFEEFEDGHRVLVLERVEGETLADCLRRGALPLVEALRVCAQIGEALEAAHARGVIHRDLKPGNVMLGSRGLIKVLDFGLARTSGSGADSAGDPARGATRRLAGSVSDASEMSSAPDDRTMTALTPSDLSSGTPGYMSPEQVRGDAQDERTDVFAFGCVLYECLTGKRAFSGRNQREAKSAVLQDAPNWELLPRQTSASIRELLAQCLAKDPEHRLRSIHTARVEIEDALGIRRASALRTGEAVAATPNNLPKQPTTFVGREKALEDCLGLLGSTRLLTLTGVGGCGKTRLAVRLAEDSLHDYPEGVWFADLASLSDPERVPQAVASAVGVREEPGSTLNETLARYFGEKRALIVLDNCEHLLEACAGLAEVLLHAAAELKLVATSREGLGVRWERTYAVPSLSLPEASAPRDRQALGAFESVRLFVDRATLVQPGFTLTDESAAVVGEICRRLDGIPLAIELAAARIRVLSPEQIQAKLHDRFRLLAGGSKAALPRHQTLRAAIQWSYDQLTPDEQGLLRALSVFTGGWTLEAAVAVCGNGRDEFEVLDLLTHLVDKSLVIVERPDGAEPRYRFLETVRQFGRDLLMASGEGDASRNSHCDWFVALVERAQPHLTGTNQAEWLDRLESEHDNIRAAFDWSLGADSRDAASLRLAAAMAWFWIIRGYIGEGRERLEAVLAKADLGDLSAVLATVIHGAGNMAFRQDDYPAARSYFEQAMAVREKLDDRRGVAGSLGSLGNVAQYQGRYLEARSLFEKSLAINREVGHRLWEATNLNCLGNVSRHLGELEASRDYLEQAAALNREIGNRTGEATSLDGLGSLMMQLGDVTAAETFFERALAIEREAGNLHDEAVSLSSLGDVARRRGDLERSRSMYADSLKLMRRLGSRLQVAANLENLAAVAATETRLERAASLWAAADSLRQAIGAPLPPDEQERHGREQAAVRASLGETLYDKASAAGRAMSMDRAIEYALETPVAT